MNPMNRRCMQVVWTLLLGAALCGHALAQEKHPMIISAENVKSHYTQQLAIDVDDVTGHQVRVFEFQRLFPVGARPEIDGEKIVEQWSRGFSNYAGGVGPAWNYTTYITDRGNKIFAQTIGTSDTTARANGSRYGSYHGTQQFVGGTGHFAQIRGAFVDVSEFDTDPSTGFSKGTSRGEYWFAQ